MNGLSDRDREYLAVRGLTDDVITGRGYYTETDPAGLVKIAYSKAKAQTLGPVLVIPVWGLQPSPVAALHQIRPHNPDREPGTGRVRKFLFPARAQMGLDVHPTKRKDIGNPAVPLLITEGYVKADAATSRLGVCAIGLPGVYGFRGRNGYGGLTLLSEWEMVAFNDGRLVVIGYDADVMVNDHVRDALDRLGRLAEGRGAKVRYLYLPAGEGGANIGIDDWCARRVGEEPGITPGELWSTLLILTDGTPRRAGHHNNGTTVAKANKPQPAQTSLAETIAVFSEWLEQRDLIPLYSILACYAANMFLEGDSIWLVVVGGSGWGKTAQVHALRGLPGTVTVSSISGEAALLSGTIRKERADDATGGIMYEIGKRGVLVVKDFTSILSMDFRERGKVIAAFREIADGHWPRRIGAEGARVINWDGKCGFVGGSTEAIERAHIVMGEKGPRFILIRIPAQDDKAVAEKAYDQEDETVMSAALAGAVAGLFAKGLPQQPSEPDEINDKPRIVALARLVAKARSAVDRDNYRQEIELVHTPEAPTRLTKAFHQMWRAATAIGCEADTAWKMVHRLGFDTIPKLRCAALKTIQQNENGPMTTTEVRIAIDHPHNTTQRTLEDLAAQGVLQASKVDQNNERSPNQWEITKWAADLINEIGGFPKTCDPNGERGQDENEHQTSTMSGTASADSSNGAFPNTCGGTGSDTHHTSNSGSYIPREPPQQHLLGNGSGAAVPSQPADEVVL